MASSSNDPSRPRYPDARTFRDAVDSGEAGPADLPAILAALCLTRRGDWDAAHDLANGLGTRLGDRLHGLLHVIEGDRGNAGYWYARAGARLIANHEVESEWLAIATDALAAEERAG